MNENRPPSLTAGYEARSDNFGPMTYSDEGFLNMIFDATGLATAADQMTVLDLMSGPGKVGIGISERDPRHKYLFLDMSNTLTRIDSSFGRVRADARALPIRDEVLDVVVARYSFKDLQTDEQPGVLTDIWRTLKPGGRLVIADMIAMPGSKRWLNSQHSLKQQMSGRTEEEGVCSILTEEEMILMASEIGLKLVNNANYISMVNSSDWVNSGQISLEQQEEIDEFILSASDDAKKDYNIRNANDGKGVLIDFPVRILAFQK